MALPNLDRRTPAALAALAAAAAAGCVVFVFVAFSWALDDAGAEEKFVARLIAYQLDQKVRTAKIILAEAALRLGETGDTSTGASKALAGVAAALAHEPDFSAFEIRTPDGRVVAATVPTSDANGERPLPDFFQSLAASRNDFHIGYVARAARGGRQAFMTIGHRIDDEHGNLRAIAGVSVDLARFQEAIAATVSLRNRTLLLIRTDGAALLRFPELAQDVAGLDMRERPVFRRSLAGETEGFYRAISPFDGIERLGGFALSPDRDFLVLTARSVRDILRGTLVGRGQIALGSGAVLLLLAVAAPIFAAQALRRRKAIEEERENLVESLNLADVGIAVADGTDRSIRFVNYAFEKLTGYTSADILGKNCRILQGPLTDPAAVMRLREALANDMAVRTDILNYTKDGKPYWSDLTIAPVRRADGTVRSFVSAFTDITARVEMADRLRRALAEAQQAAQAKDAFLARMSHELRTPLNAVIGFADLMQIGVKGTLSDGHRGYVEDIARSGRHLLGIVEDMLEIVRIEAGQRKFASAPLDLAHETREASRMAFAELDNVGATLELRAAGPAQALGDPQAVRQIVVNLLANAARHGRAGGRIVVTTGSGADGFARLEVADNGPGFPAELLGQVGKPFIGHSPEIASKGGIGLGLAIVSELAARMGGTMSAANDANGAIVRVELPRAAE